MKFFAPLAILAVANGAQLEAEHWGGYRGGYGLRSYGGYGRSYGLRSYGGYGYGRRYGGYGGYGRRGYW